MSRESYTNDFNSDDTYDPKDRGKKKLIIIIASIVALILIIVIGFFVKGKLEISSLNKKAENFVEINDYQEAGRIYADLYNKTGDVEYKSKKNQMDIKAEAKSNMDEAKSLEQKGEYVKALALYKQIPPEDKDNYKKASSKISSLKSDIISKASAMMDSGNTTSASSLLSEYLGLVADDKEANDLYKKASGKTDAEIKQVISAQTSSSSGLNAANSTASSIRYSYQYVTASEANVRSGPSKSSPSIGVLYKGDTVYVYDTYVESASRIWCKINGGWISYNTLNGNFR